MSSRSQTRLGALATRTAQVIRRGRDRIRARLLMDRGGGPEDAVIVAGSARSGTTWLGEIVRAELNARLLFEPLNPDLVPAARHLHYIEYARPEIEAPHLHALMEALLSGRIRDPHWIDRDPRVLRPLKRVLKDVRACLLLGWTRRVFPETPQVFILRHPCACVASFLAFGWSADRDVDAFLAQPELISDHIGLRVQLLREANQPHERAALTWCVNNRVALLQAKDGGMHCVHYEDLVRRPEEAIHAVFKALGHTPRGAIQARLNRPSRTARPGSRFGRGITRPKWEDEVSPGQVRDILRIVEAFGLSGLYDDDGRPTGTLQPSD